MLLRHATPLIYNQPLMSANISSTSFTESVKFSDPPFVIKILSTICQRYNPPLYEAGKERYLQFELLLPPSISLAYLN